MRPPAVSSQVHPAADNADPFRAQQRELMVDLVGCGSAGGADDAVPGGGVVGQVTQDATDQAGGRGTRQRRDIAVGGDTSGGYRGDHVEDPFGENHVHTPIVGPADDAAVGGL